MNEVLRRDDPVVAFSIKPCLVPALVAQAGTNARFAYDEFFAGIDSPHTARAYRHAVARFLVACEHASVTLGRVTPGFVAEHIKNLRAGV